MRLTGLFSPIVLKLANCTLVMVEITQLVARQCENTMTSPKNDYGYQVK